MLYAHMRIGNAGQMFGVSSTGVMTDSELVAVKMAESSRVTEDPELP